MTARRSLIPTNAPTISPKPLMLTTASQICYQCETVSQWRGVCGGYVLDSKRRNSAGSSVGGSGSAIAHERKALATMGRRGDQKAATALENGSQQGLCTRDEERRRVC